MLTMHRFRHLLVGLRLADSDAAVMRHAAMLADLGWVAEVHFLHVLVGGGTSHEEALARVDETVRAHFPFISDKVRVTTEVARGPLLDRLLERTAELEIDVVMVGCEPDPARRGPLGRRLAMKAPCSVWVVPRDARAEVSRLLVPVDFSEPSSDAMAVALSMARRARVEACVPLHVYFNDAAATYDDYDAVLKGREREAWDAFAAPLDLSGVKVVPLMEEGAVVAHVIERTAEAQHADLIVMSTRGRTRSAAILLGSVTEQVLSETRIPTLVVKHFGARMGLLQVLLDRRFRERPGPHFD